MEEQLCEARIENLRLKNESMSERSAWDVRLSEMTSKVNRVGILYVYIRMCIHVYITRTGTRVLAYAYTYVHTRVRGSTYTYMYTRIVTIPIRVYEYTRATTYSRYE